MTFIQFLLCSHIFQSYHQMKIHSIILIFLLSILSQITALGIKGEIKDIPNNNNGIELIKEFINHLDTFNPDSSVNYQYYEFEKLLFEHIITDSLTNQQSTSDPFFLIETLNDKKHQLPDKTKEKVISNSIAGQGDPTFMILALQFDPFNIFMDSIRYMNYRFPNPFTLYGLDQYEYVIKDTSDDDIQPFVLIEFSPKNDIRGFTGNCNIATENMAILSYSMSATSDDSTFKLSMNQTFQLLENRQWFPHTMDGTIVLNQEGSETDAIKVELKSSITTVKLNPQFSPTDFLPTTVPSDSILNREGPVNKTPQKPDINTYYLLDSLNQAMNAEKMKRLQKQMIDGKVPIGAVNLDVKKLIDYNDYEGFKFGLGLWSNHYLSKIFSTGGYFVRSTGINENKYGAGLIFSIDKKSETQTEIMWQDDYSETGTISFLEGYQKYSPESFKRFLSESMDRNKSIYFSIQSRLSNKFKTSLSARYNNVTPKLSYRFFNDTSIIESPFKQAEIKWGSKWTPKSENERAITSPTIWLNIHWGTGESTNNFRYWKYESQIEEQVQIFPSQSTTIRFVGGLLNGDYPTSLLYSTFGSYKKIGIEIPFSFATMRLNEFAVSRFLSLHFKHDIDLFHQSAGKFKPHLLLTTNYGIGDIANDEDLPKIAVFNKGFVESGIVLDNILHNYLISYGLSTHYRYGFYHLDNEIDNWAFKFSIRYNIKE